MTGDLWTGANRPEDMRRLEKGRDDVSRLLFPPGGTIDIDTAHVSGFWKTKHLESFHDGYVVFDGIPDIPHGPGITQLFSSALLGAYKNMSTRLHGDASGHPQAIVTKTASFANIMRFKV